MAIRRIDRTVFDLSSMLFGWNRSPNHHHHHRRRPKRSSINGNALLSTVATVHELMSFVIYKGLNLRVHEASFKSLVVDHPPNWLKQTDLYQEYTNKSDQINIDHSSSDVLPHCHQQLYRKQRCNLHLYARSDQSWQPRPSRSRTPIHRRADSVESKHEVRSSPLRSAPISDLFSPLNVSVKQETREENALQASSKSKSTKRTAKENTRRRQILCKKKLPDNAPTHRRLRRQRTNSVENQGNELVSPPPSQTIEMERPHSICVMHPFQFPNHRPHQYTRVSRVSWIFYRQRRQIENERVRSIRDVGSTMEDATWPLKGRCKAWCPAPLSFLNKAIQQGAMCLRADKNQMNSLVIANDENRI